MNRAMFSGVAGLKAHQSRMDVIGNNIANVNTYGYKDQRAVFSDVYYQVLSAASGGTATKGGTNPSTVGVGSMLSTVETLQTQSGTQTTSSKLDAAIEGEGFFQVMDGSGNISYTRVGMFFYDPSTGYLLDGNGNFVLGNTGTSDTGNGLQKIKLNDVGTVQPKAASDTMAINGSSFTLSATNDTDKGDMSVNITSSDSLPIGKPVEATIANGIITVTLNARSKFTSIEDLNTKINSAITVANGGKAIAAGDLTLSTDNSAAFTGGLTGAEIAGTNYGYNYGKIEVPSSGILGGFKFDSVGAGFTAASTDKASFGLLRTPASADGTTEESFTMYCTVGGNTYSGTVTKSQMASAGKLVLSNGGSTTDTITMSYPTYTTMMDSASYVGATWAPVGSGTSDLTAQLKSGTVMGGIKVSGLDSGDYVTKVTAGTVNAATTSAGPTSTLTIATKNGGTYTGTVDFSSSFSTGTVTLTNGTKQITVTLPSKAEYLSAATGGITFNESGSALITVPNSNPAATLNSGNTATGYAATSTTKSRDLGLGSKAFQLTGGTAGGAVTMDKVDNIAIGPDGSVTVHNSDKGTVQVGTICLAVFANPTGLQASGSNYFKATVNSGAASITQPGKNSGSLKTSALEMSGVDLSNEFADMITTQRGFQANARIITVSDTMLEELINLKR